jgi:hypothetical protein
MCQQSSRSSDRRRVSSGMRVLKPGAGRKATPDERGKLKGRSAFAPCGLPGKKLKFMNTLQPRCSEVIESAGAVNQNVSSAKGIGKLLQISYKPARLGRRYFPRKIPQARELNDVARRQDRADEIRLRRGVNFAQMTLPSSRNCMNCWIHRLRCLH